jgi:hypothetical protein
MLNVLATTALISYDEIAAFVKEISDIIVQGR